MKKDISEKSVVTNNRNKIAMIVTWCDADVVVNYGQVLQSCAMAMAVSKLGYKRVMLVSYRERNIRLLWDYYYHHFNPFLNSFKASCLTREMIKRIMSETKVEFYQLFRKEQVEKLAMQADVLICGSDQIWHPCEYNRVLFLDMGRPDAERIAYAASQPMGRIYPEYRQVFRKMEKHLKEFNAISIREKGNIPMFEQMSGKRVENVVDPTLLFTKNEWRKYEKRIDIPEKYILLYIPAQLNRLAEAVLRELQKKTGIKQVVCLAPRCNTKIPNVTYYNSIGTPQFLFLVRNAAYVCTSYFHGVIFSIIMEKEFWCYKWRFVDRRSDLRLDQITEISGLEERLIDTPKKININKKIDYTEVKNKLQPMINRSYEFLKKNYCD